MTRTTGNRFLSCHGARAAALVAVLAAGCAGPGSGLAVSPERASYRAAGEWIEAGGKLLSEPFGIAVSARNGSVLVTDARNHRVVVFSADGRFLREFGAEGEGPGEFAKPTGVAVGPDGSVYVADYDLDRVQKFGRNGEFVLEWGHAGKGNREFRSPNGLAVDSAGNVYVADFYNKVVKVFDVDGRFLRTIGCGGQWGRGALDYPTDVELLPDGHLLVADAYNYRLQLFEAGGDPIAVWGWHLLWVCPRPAAATTGFDVPTGVAADVQGRFVHVADSANYRVVMLDREGRFVTDFKIEDRKGAFNTPVALAVSPDGRRVYATDIANDRVVVLEVRDE